MHNGRVLTIFWSIAKIKCSEQGIQKQLAMNNYYMIDAVTVVEFIFRILSVERATVGFVFLEYYSFSQHLFWILLPLHSFVNSPH